MATSREDLYKKLYPAFKTREGAVFSSPSENGFQYKKPAMKNVPIFYEYFAPQLLRNELGNDGIYTWVLLNTGDFFSIRTLTGQETGTLHENILKYIFYQYRDEFPEPERQFVASGELYLETDGNSGYRRIFFNFESGTFLKLVLSGKTEEEQVALQKNLVPHVQSYLERICPAGCFIQPMLGTSFFSLFHLYTDPSILSNLNTFLSRNPPSKPIENNNSSSFNNHKKPGTLYISKGGRRKTKGRKTKGRKTKGRKTKGRKQGTKKKSLSMKKK